MEDYYVVRMRKKEHVVEEKQPVMVKVLPKLP